MAAAKVIHFGCDDCYRINVLRHVGYEVRESDSLERLQRDLERDEDLDAVIIAGVAPRCAEQAAVLVRQHSGAPLILFRRPDDALDESRFDRVFSWFSPDTHWLYSTAVLVMQSKELRTQSERLTRDSRAVVEQSRRQRARSAELRRKLPPAWPGPDETNDND
jgi:hypothetical protein